jgi:two-component system, sensor histidine kinase and response regulator
VVSLRRKIELPLVILIGLLSISNILSAQHNEADSLESLIKSVPSDTGKVWLINRLVTVLRERDNNKALSYAYQAKDLAELLRYDKGLALALENLGWILYRKGNYTKSFDYSAQALKLNEEARDDASIARCYINLAAIHYEQKQYEPAIKYFKQALAVSGKIRDNRTMARSLNNIAYTFLQMNKLDSAEFYVKKAVDHSEAIEDQYMIAFATRTMADVFEARKDYDSALENLKKCIAISDKEGNIFLKTSSLHRIAKVYSEKGELDKAIPFLIENIALATQYDYKEELERTYKLLSEVYDKKKDVAKAYEYQSRYLNVHDSLYVQRQSEKITLMQARFNDEIKQAQIELLMKEAQLNEEEIKSQKVWLYFSIGCLSLMLILAFVLFYSNRYNSMAKRQLQLKNAEINSQTYQLKNLNATKDKLFSIISHDLRSPLASLKALMELVGTPGLTHDEFVTITKTLKKSLDSVHDDLDNLLLWAQTQLKGLQAAPEPVDLKTLVDEKITLFNEAAQAKKISMTNDVKEGTFVYADPNHIGLALRNLLANAIKFNPVGGTITITSTNRGDMNEVSVIDSGIGIAMDDITKLFNAETHFTKPGTHRERGAGIGLLITKEFIENNHGSIWVTSELGKGSTFTFTLRRTGAAVAV